MLIEDLEEAGARGRKGHAEILGWGLSGGPAPVGDWADDRPMPRGPSNEAWPWPAGRLRRGPDLRPRPTATRARTGWNPRRWPPWLVPRARALGVFGQGGLGGIVSVPAASARRSRPWPCHPAACRRHWAWRTRSAPCPRARPANGGALVCWSPDSLRRNVRGARVGPGLTGGTKKVAHERWGNGYANGRGSNPRRPFVRQDDLLRTMSPSTRPSTAWRPALEAMGVSKGGPGGHADGKRDRLSAGAVCRRQDRRGAGAAEPGRHQHGPVRADRGRRPQAGGVRPPRAPTGFRR